jgi:hypothetical protein
LKRKALEFKGLFIFDTIQNTLSKRFPDTIRLLFPFNIKGSIDAIVAEVHTALKQTGGNRFLLGPGCSLNIKVPEVSYMAVKKTVSSYREGDLSG